MQNIKGIKSDFELLGALRTVCEAYEEIAVIRMRRVKNNVLSTRDFLSKIGDIFANLRSYEKKLKLEEEKSGKKAEKKKPTGTLKKEQINGEPTLADFERRGTVSILLAPNSKMYGDIVSRTYRVFRDKVNNSETDVVILGKVGKEFYEKEAKKKQYTYFDIPDSGVTLEDLKPVIYHVSHYEKIDVYFGKFESFITQNPTSQNLLGQEFETKSNQDFYGYIYEPNFPTVKGFFETQIFASLLKQSVFEGQLGRFASRVKAMESALENIDNNSRNLRSSLRRVQRQVENRKQIGIISGLSLWQK